MAWGKKDEKKLLPDLPPYRQPMTVSKPTAQDSSTHLEEENEEIFDEKHELPSFPDSLNDKGFSQAAIKDAVGSHLDESEIAAPSRNYPQHSDSEPEKIFSGARQKYQTIEMEEWSPSMKKEETVALPLPRNISEEEYRPSLSGGRLEEPPTNYPEVEALPRKVPKNSDIFVKLDKFYLARKTLFDAQGKLQEIDALLRKIRETKLREEQEIRSWEGDLISIKTKINDVALNLFEKID